MSQTVLQSLARSYSSGPPTVPALSCGSLLILEMGYWTITNAATGLSLDDGNSGIADGAADGRPI